MHTTCVASTFAALAEESASAFEMKFDENHIYLLNCPNVTIFMLCNLLSSEEMKRFFMG